MCGNAASRAITCIIPLWIAGCGHYSDFTLPVQPGGSPAAFNVTLDRDPVLSPGASGQWDSSDVLNPSVVVHDQQFWNFYSGFDGKVWRTGVAKSRDGLKWTQGVSVLSPDPNNWDRGYIAANGSVLRRNGQFLYWYQAGQHDGVMRIGVARSADGLQFVKEPAPVLDTGPYRSWDERAVADPYVIEIGAWLYMYYLGQDRAGRQRIGVARSQDGIRWEKLRRNPILDLSDPGSGGMDENGTGEPAVFVWKGLYRMLITGRDAHEYRRMAALWSNDGVHWTRQPGAISGDQSWDSAVICDPTVIVDGGRIRFWFGGGDVARPDERIHGRIGTGSIQ
jgi:predicted GH43/DUF377 family glycosyl hydrolase